MQPKGLTRMKTSESIFLFAVHAQCNKCPHNGEIGNDCGSFSFFYDAHASNVGELAILRKKKRLLSSPFLITIVSFTNHRWFQLLEVVLLLDSWR